MKKDTKAILSVCKRILKNGFNMGKTPFLLVTIFFSNCKNGEQRKVTMPSAKSIENKTHLKEEPIPNDSLQLAAMLDRTYEIAIKDFERKVDTVFNDWNYVGGNTEVQFSTGIFFNKAQQYLLVRRSLASDIHINIYKFERDGFGELLHYEENKLVYQRDTIMYVNGDGLNDFCIVTYSSSGCCRRNVFEIHLTEKNGRFNKAVYKFINPTFYSDEKIIRGVGYGHPGEVCLYKYKWQGLKIDTIETLCPDRYNKLKFRRNEWAKSKTDTGLLLTSLPKEYLSVTDIDWFLNY